MAVVPTKARIGRRLALSLVGGIALAVAIGTLTSRALVGQDQATTWAVLITGVYMALGIALLVAFASNSSMRREILALQPAPAAGYRMGAAAWIGAYCLSGLIYLMAQVAGFDALEVVDVLLWVGADGGRLETASAGVIALILLRVCLIVPVTEELLFRGALYSWLRGRLSAWWTCAITGIAFGLVHQIPVFIPLAIVVGVAAGWVREKTGSVLPTIVMHAIQNVAVVVASFVATGWDPTWSMG